MKLIIAGGCGEHGRNCFYVNGDDLSFLVDCGIMAGEAGGGYPHLSALQVKNLSYVFLTHSHADHTGALPWLIEHGFHGTIIASAETLAQLPFSLAVSTLVLESVCPNGLGKIDSLVIHWGRSGHCVGSVWYHFAQGVSSILFSGDYTETTQVYSYDPIKNMKADIAVLDCAYGYDTTAYAEYCKKLCSSVSDSLRTHQIVFLPVPKYGRGLELLKLFAENKITNKFFGDTHFLATIKNIEHQRFWFDQQRISIPDVCHYDGQGSGIVFISNPQLRNAEHILQANTVLERGGIGLMTGTVEAGSNSEKLILTGKMQMIRYPVHLNYTQYTELAAFNSFKTVIPYHCPDIQASSDYLP